MRLASDDDPIAAETAEHGPAQPLGVPPVTLAVALTRRYGVVVLRVALPAVVIALVWRELAAVDVHAVRALVRGVPLARLCLLLVGTLGLIAVAGLYDLIAFPAAGSLNGPRRWAFGMLTAAWTNFLAIGPFGGPALRLYVYRRAGLEAREIASRLALMYGGMLSGFAGWAAVALLPLGTGAWTSAARGAAAIVLAPVIAVAIAAGQRRLHRQRATLPVRRLASLGLVGAFDWGLVFFVFVAAVRSTGVHAPAGALLRPMMLGYAAGFASMIPGGIGSADAVWISQLSGDGVSVSAATAAILLFRFVLYIVPWVLSLVVLFLMFSAASDIGVAWQRRIVGAAVGLNGVFLLASAALPAVPGWVTVLGDWLPLGVFEISHVASVVAAVLMLFLVRGIYRGYRSAFMIVAGALAASVVVHFLRGAGIGESITSAALLLLLLGARRSFVKQGRVPIGGEIVLATAVTALTTFLLVGLIGSANVTYNSAQWTALGFDADPSRFLRGALIVAFVSVAFMVRQAVVPASRAVFAAPEEIDHAIAFIQNHSDRATALSVACGDKAIWRSGDDGLVVYQLRGDKMIVLGDPVVVSGAERTVLDALMTYAETTDFDLVFYQISGGWMERLHEYGFEFFKLGEEGVLDIAGYTLEGGHKSGLRRTIRKTEEAGIHFRAVQPPVNDAHIAAARDVSDAWLRQKGVHELQFSVGYFSPAYLRRFPLGMAVDSDGRMVAFVNLTGARPGTEMTMDFVRYRSGVVDNLMDYVLVSSFLWARDRGYTTFSMGMAPLFDVGERPGAHLTEKLARQLFLHGEHYYNYQGLLAYKTKFHPRWEPRYMAYHDSWNWAGATVAVANLVHARSRADRRRIAAVRLGT
jgi:phosphatidylglycerol lysyltransferase